MPNFFGKKIHKKRKKSGKKAEWEAEWATEEVDHLDTPFAEQPGPGGPGQPTGAASTTKTTTTITNKLLKKFIIRATFI